MTQDEIMELAEQAELADKYGTINYEYGYRDEIIAFAKLVAAKEFEKYADKLNERSRQLKTVGGSSDLCANDLRIHAASIRARGEA